MSWYNSDKPEGIVKCPIDPLHIVSNSRLQYHIVKCIKNFPDTKFYFCDYNRRHVFKSELEFRQHIIICPDAQLIDRFDCGRPIRGCMEVPAPTTAAIVSNDGDSWDSDVDDESVTALGALAEKNHIKPEEPKNKVMVKYVRKKNPQAAAPGSKELLPRKLEPVSNTGENPYAFSTRAGRGWAPLTGLGDRPGLVTAKTTSAQGMRGVMSKSGYSNSSTESRPGFGNFRGATGSLTSGLVGNEKKKEEAKMVRGCGIVRNRPSV